MSKKYIVFILFKYKFNEWCFILNQSFLKHTLDCFLLIKSGVLLSLKKFVDLKKT